MEDSVCSTLASLQNPEVILHDKVTGKKGSIVDAAMNVGIKAICVSFGFLSKADERFEKNFIDSIFKTMVKFYIIH
jgi:hypothetical protein